MPKVGGKYKHYKGGLYKVLVLVKHSETHEDMVVYQNVEQPEKIWARPLSMFMEQVEVEGKTMPRFTYLE